MPNRIIKDSIRTSDTVNALNDFDFRLWLYLITFADDFGRGSADLDVVKGMVFPKLKITHKKIEQALQDLDQAQAIQLYEVDGKRYFQFPNWSRHQQPRAKISKYPAPCNQMISDDIICNQMHGIHETIHDTRYTNTNTKLYSGKNTYTEGIDSAEQRAKLKQALLAIEEEKV